jgi:aminoglycoside/choline kinase family phosphotransferase
MRADDNIPAMQPAQSSNRQHALEGWVRQVIQSSGEIPGTFEPVLGDASFRRFYRIRAGATSYIAMDAPPQTENNQQFVRLSAFFRTAGLHVPEVIAQDLDEGFLLVSDLGDLLYFNVYQTPQRDVALEAALQALLTIQRIPDPQSIIPPFTRQRLHDELTLFRTWLVEGLLGQLLTAAEGGMLQQTWTGLIENADAQPKVTVHRDYHSRNLLWGADQVTRIVDFQDALSGPLSYDLASLLRDCYVRFDATEVARWRERYRTLAAAAGLPVDADPSRFAQVMDLTAVQRQLKALGIFARLELRDSRSSHLVDIAPVLEQLIDVTQMYAEFGSFSNWLAERIRPQAHAVLTARGVTCTE